MGSDQTSRGLIEQQRMKITKKLKQIDTCLPKIAISRSRCPNFQAMKVYSQHISVFFFLSNLIDLCFCCQVWDCVCSEMKVRRKDRIGLPSRGLHRTVSWNISPNCFTISNSFCIVFIFIFLFRNVRQSLTLWEAESNNLAAILNVSHGQHIEKSIESVKLNTETQR